MYLLQKILHHFPNRFSVINRKKGVEGELPVYAKQDEADIFELNAEEYQRLIKKYGEIKSVSVDGLFMDVTAGSSVNLPETLNVRYSDDSVAKMGVTWDTEGTGLDFDKAAVGTYKINGTIIGTTEYNSLLQFLGLTRLFCIMRVTDIII